MNEAQEPLVGSNKMEILLFSLGGTEIFGINVFKVREVCGTPKVTKTPNMPAGVKGLISLRGNVIPVISLAASSGFKAGDDAEKVMMVTEYNQKILGFLVSSVDKIVRVDWSRVKAPENLSTDGLITAITPLDDGRLVSILDVESLLSRIFGEARIEAIEPLEGGEGAHVFFADDSAVARKKIIEVLDGLGVRHSSAVNGAEALRRLQAIADHCEHAGRPVSEEISLIMVDAEMPEMDGYVLTKHIKADSRFKGISVVMHSSLSSEANKSMGVSVGVDTYVAKFDAQNLVRTIRPLIL